MKFTLCVALLTVTGAVNAQTTNTSDSLFIVTYTVGSSWDASKQPNEQMYFKEHSANLSKLRKEGVIKTGARFADKGMIVITAKSFTTAKEIILSDIAVVNRLFETDIQRLNVFYEGCLERPK
ncbi:MAG TPA: hypothetical protein PKJ83_08310 [Cyclobacteriaceae bacterium]|nr:hypothetical protein [Cyclobacteriaceae bacterium]HPW61672.1 hypothetical protein [Cyclobacteriaceae bacterium]